MSGDASRGDDAQRNRTRWLIQGAAYPLALTVLTMAFGLFSSLADDAARPVLVHALNAWRAVIYGLIASLFLGGTSIVFLFTEAGTRPGAWRFAGGLLAFTPIATAAWLTADVL